MPARPRVTLNLNASQFAPDRYGDIVEVARMAEASGIVDDISLGEHVVMGIDPANFPAPGGQYPGTFDDPWVEPLVTLGAIASVTTDLGLMTSILIAPLRSAPLLAKQAATLDQLSGGRLTLGVSTSWQKAEYDAVGVSHADRGRVLDDTIAACRALWSEFPASFESETVSFTDIYCSPQPTTPGGPPIWFGGKASARQVRRVVAWGDGWLPFGSGPDEIAESTAAMKAGFEAQGRDPESLQVLGLVFPLKADGTMMMGPMDRGDITASLAGVPAIVAGGANVLGIGMHYYCKDVDSSAAFFEEFGNDWADLGFD